MKKATLFKQWQEVKVFSVFYGEILVDGKKVAEVDYRTEDNHIAANLKSADDRLRSYSIFYDFVEVYSFNNKFIGRVDVCQLTEDFNKELDALIKIQNS